MRLREEDFLEPSDACTFSIFIFRARLQRKSVHALLWRRKEGSVHHKMREKTAKRWFFINIKWNKKIQAHSGNGETGDDYRTLSALIRQNFEIEAIAMRIEKQDKSASRMKYEINFPSSKLSARRQQSGAAFTRLHQRRHKAHESSADKNKLILLLIEIDMVLTLCARVHISVVSP